MKIKPFAVEEWMNTWEDYAVHNIAETCVDSITIDELFSLCDIDKQAFWDEFCKKRMTYGAIESRPGFKAGLCKLFKTIKSEEIITAHGAIGANHHVFYSLIEPGDRVISIMPTYQQLYSIPEAYGADVQIVKLKKENGYLPDIEEIKSLATPETKMICINNPNNPTGALMDAKYMEQIIEIAKSVDAYILCDEVYRHLTQEDIWSDSIADLYEKGISVGSMSKVFSLAGLRLGWIASHDEAFLKSCISHRDYNLISCGMFDEEIAEIAMTNVDKLLARSKAIVRENLQILDKWVNEEEHVSYVKPQAGTTALVYYDLPVDSYTFCEGLMKDSGTLVTPGDAFEEPCSIRIGYAYGTQGLKDGLAAISKYIEKLAEEN